MRCPPVKFTIIVPAYNLESYLADCLLSIQNQTYADYEVLVIDDGSLDGTYQIAKDFADRDSRFRVFSKSNGGVSSARNLGLEHAHGEYIWFIDGDDYIHPDSLSYLEKAFRLFSDIDYITFACRQVLYPYSVGEMHWTDLSHVGHECYDCHTMEGFISAFTHSPREACLTCYKHEFLANEKFESFALGEDTLFAKKVVYKAKKVVWTPNILYSYRYRENSASRVTKLPHVIDYFEVCRELYNFKGLNSGWGDRALAAFCCEVSFVDGMARLRSLPVACERQAAYVIWMSIADAYLEKFGSIAQQKVQIELMCKYRWYWLSEILFYSRYFPRRYIGRSPRLVAVLRTLRLLPSGSALMQMQG